MRTIFILIFAVMAQISFAQEMDSVTTAEETKNPAYFGATVSVTTKGISTVPSLTLGKPAAFFDFAAGIGKVSFEPQFRFGLDGKPWTFMLWLRYKAVQSDKFNLTFATHPSFSFRTKIATINDATYDVITVQRYLVGDITPSFTVAKNISIVPYYFYSYGMDKNMTKHNHFLQLRVNFSDIPISKQYFMRFVPQAYYLKLDAMDGFYFGSTLVLAKRDFPLSVSSMFNKEITSNITGSHDFLWNVSLIYAFNKQFNR